MATKASSQAGKRRVGSKYSGMPTELPNKTLHATRNVIGNKGHGEASHPAVKSGSRQTGRIKKGG